MRVGVVGVYRVDARGREEAIVAHVWRHCDGHGDGGGGSLGRHRVTAGQRAVHGLALERQAVGEVVHGRQRHGRGHVPVSVVVAAVFGSGRRRRNRRRRAGARDGAAVLRGRIGLVGRRGGGEDGRVRAAAVAVGVVGGRAGVWMCVQQFLLGVHGWCELALGDRRLSLDVRYCLRCCLRLCCCGCRERRQGVLLLLGLHGLAIGARGTAGAGLGRDGNVSSTSTALEVFQAALELLA